MSLILDPANAADNAGYDGLRTLVGITLTNAEIDVHPLFEDAEEFVVDVVPAAELPSGRTYVRRNRVIRALQFLTKYNFLYDSTSSGSSSSGGGTRAVSSESETVGQISKTTQYSDFGGTTTTDYTHGVDNQTEFYLNSAYEILKELNPNFEIPAQHDTIISGGGVLPSPTALLTKSTLVQ